MDANNRLLNYVNPLALFGCAVAMAALLASERYLIQGKVLGPLFMVPLLVAAAFLPRWAIFLLANLLAVAREAIGPDAWTGNVPARLSLSMLAFSGGALFAGEIFRNRRLAMALIRKTMEEARTRADAENEVRALVEGSPSAILTVNSQGVIAIANEAARHLLGFGNVSLVGEPVEKYIPTLAQLVKSRKAIPRLRTLVECRGRRRNGDPCYLQFWVSSYEVASGPQLAAIVSDAADQLRDREEAGLRQLLSSSKIIAGAVSHEIRNLTGAAAVLHHNLGSCPGLTDNPDFQALGKVIESTLKLSSDEVEADPEEALEGVDVVEVLEELRLIITQAFEEAGAKIEWEVPASLPRAHANHSALLQVFINLAQNSCRVLEGRAGGKLRITAYALAESVVVRFADNGPGISPEQPVFQPFQTGSSSTGLGLFVSRACLRTFGGELHHTQRPGECCFIVELPPIVAAEVSRA